MGDFLPWHWGKGNYLKNRLPLFRHAGGITLVCLLISLSLSLSMISLGQKPPSGGKEDYKLVVDINLVELQTLVTTPNGALVPNLKKEDFQVFDNGKEQEIALFARELDQPLNLCLLFDASGSVLIELKTEQETATEFLKKIIRPIDRVSIFQVTDEVDELVHSSNRTDQFGSVLRSIKPGGATSLYDAIFLAAENLSAAKGRKVIVLITDGDDTTSTTRMEECIWAAQNIGAVTYPLVIQPIKNSAGENLAGQHSMIYIAEKTGGKFFLVRSMEQLRSTFDDLSAELRTLYVLGYYPNPSAQDGAFHKVEVRTSNSQFQVRHREGYSTTPLSRIKKTTH
jgi:Ca-activated chloride channel homolog